MASFNYVCPSCGTAHTVDDLNDEDEYDGLCEECEKEWVESAEYARALESIR